MGGWDKLESKIVIIASGIIIFSILSFGAVEIWSSAIMKASVFTLMIIYLIWGRTDTPLQISKEEKYMIVALFGFLVYVVVQMIPFPSIILKYLSPESFNIYSYYTTDKDPTMSISLYAYKTGIEFLMMLTYSLFFIVLAFSIKDMSTLQRMLKILVYFGFGLAIFAIIQKATWNGKLYWLRELTMQGAGPFGPFVSRNNYAGFINMLIPLSLGLAFTRRNRERQLLFGFFALIMAVSLFISLSRGGIISFFAGIIIFALFLAWDRFRTNKRWALAAFVFAVFLYLLYLGIDPIIDRFYKTDLAREDRFAVWSATFNAFKDFYFTGSGLGTFINIFPFYTPQNIDINVIFDHAHNDYLEFILEAGIIGTILLILFLYFFIRCIVSSKWDRYTGIFRVSLLSSIATMVVHSISDFNLHIPSNALMLSAVFGMAVAASRLAVRLGGQDDKQVKEEEY